MISSYYVMFTFADWTGRETNYARYTHVTSMDKLLLDNEITNSCVRERVIDFISENDVLLHIEESIKSSKDCWFERTLFSI